MNYLIVAVFCCRVASLDKDVFDALMLVKVKLDSCFVGGCFFFFFFFFFPIVCFIRCVFLMQRLGPDVREGKRRQFNYIGMLKCYL